MKKLTTLAKKLAALGLQWTKFPKYETWRSANYRTVIRAREVAAGYTELTIVVPLSRVNNHSIGLMIDLRPETPDAGN